MTRFLSESLQAPEPFFRLGLRKLEMANGNPSTDIRFSTEILQSTQAKIRELGLDPAKVTAAELYQRLQERVAADDQRLVKALRARSATHVSADGDLVAGMVHVINKLPDTKQCYALKSSRLKSMLRQLPPRKTLKQFGYRSLDSFLKHEPPLLALAAAWLIEGETWQKHLLGQYKKLRPADFEERTMQIIRTPDSKYWHEIATQIVESTKHNLLCFKEMGALIILPLPSNLPPGAATVSFSLALHELNEIRASSSFLKLSRVRPNFGILVQTIASDEPYLDSQLLDEPVPWQLVQRYYAKLTHLFREDIFEPHLEQADLRWQPVEDTLATIEPSFAFWRETTHLGLLDNHQPVSLNLIDSALNYCNNLPFEQRMSRYFQYSLWHELLLRYLRHEPLEQSVIAQLQPRLSAETVLA